MHSAAINSIAADASGRYAVTASEDKTLRIWDLASHELLSVLRPPSAPGHEGKLFATAMSPDGQVVATSGYTGYDWDSAFSIYVFERQSGVLRRRITGLPNSVLSLAISRDGRRLAATLGDRHGVRVFALSDGALLWQDESCNGDSYGSDFDAKHRLLTSCNDGYLRLYAADGRLLRKVKGSGHEPYAVRFAPEGQRLAVGYEDRAVVEVYAAQDLRLLLRPDVSGLLAGHLKSVAWSSDGQQLYAAGKRTLEQEEAGEAVLRTWNARGARVGADVPIARGEVQSLHSLPGQRLLFAASEPRWGMLQAGHVRFSRGGAGLDPGSELWATADGQAIRVRSPTHGQFVEFRVPELAYAETAAANPQFLATRTQHPQLPLRGFRNSRQLQLGDTLLPLQPYEMSRTLSISEDGQNFLIGADWSLRWFLADKRQKWQVPTPTAVRAVHLSADGRWAIAALGDGSIRWYEGQDGREVLTLFVHADRRRWLLYTPAGSYAASVGGEDFVGWQLNRSPEQAADFFPVPLFRARSYLPAEVAGTLGRMPAATTPPLPPSTYPPVVTISAPVHGALFSTPSVELTFSVRAPGSTRISAIRAYVDGREVASRGVFLSSGESPSPALSGDTPQTWVVPLPAHDAIVSLVAESASLRSQPARVALRYQNRAAATTEPGVDLRPKLYLLAIGVSKYQREGLRLDFPAKDAQDLAQAFRDRGQKLYRAVETKVLTDASATKDAILGGLDWLRRETTQHDVAALFLAGHGINDPASSKYYYLPYEADPSQVLRSMVPGSEIQTALTHIAGKVLLFLDSCHAGNVLGDRRVRGLGDVNRFVNELASAENGVVVFTASTGIQSSQESSAWNNGAFTKALVEGLRGQADFRKSGRVTVSMLDLYISERVKELTGGAQTPTTAKPETISDFPIVLSL